MTREGLRDGQVAFYWGNKTTPQLNTLYLSGDCITGDYAYDTDKGCVLFFDSTVGWGSQQFVPLNTISDSSSGEAIVIDCNIGNTFEITLDNTIATRELATPINHKAGSTYLWIIKQNSIGGALLTFGSFFKFPEGTPPVLTVSANSVDLISGVSDGVNIYCSSVADLY